MNCQIELCHVHVGSSENYNPLIINIFTHARMKDEIKEFFSSYYEYCTLHTLLVVCSLHRCLTRSPLTGIPSQHNQFLDPFFMHNNVSALLFKRRNLVKKMKMSTMLLFLQATC